MANSYNINDIKESLEDSIGSIMKLVFKHFHPDLDFDSLNDTNKLGLYMQFYVLVESMKKVANNSHSYSFTNLENSYTNCIAKFKVNLKSKSDNTSEGYITYINDGINNPYINSGSYLNIKKNNLLELNKK